MLFLNSIKYRGKQYGKYTIIKPVGEGRYGMCFLAHSNEGTPVIIKRFKPNFLKKNKEKNAYEAVILSQINHIAIPKFLGVINEKCFYGFVLELKQGITIEAMLFKYKYSFSDIEIYSIGIQLIAVIKYLHQNGIIHRDIRIPNVILDNSKIYLVDLGLARWTDDKRYSFDIDFSYLGDFLLYLIYSSYKRKGKYKNKPWSEELSLSYEQKVFLKRLLMLENPYKNIAEVEIDFLKAFGKY